MRNSLILAFLSLSAFPFALMGLEEGPVWQLRSATVVDSAGIYLDQVVVQDQTTSVPHLRLAPAPPPGQCINLTPATLLPLLQSAHAEATGVNWSGARTVKVTRRMRTMEELELKQLLTATLQKEHVKDKGELEIRLSRPWTPIQVPDEVLTLNILDLPASGVTPYCIVRFEIRCAAEACGTFHCPVQSKVWRDIWVARTPLTRGQVVALSDLVRERRDVFTLREALAPVEMEGANLEVAESVQAGAPVYARSLRPRAVIRRGRIVEALVRDGSLSITVKAEALEDGALGQLVRLRNLNSKREFHGKVQNEQEVLVAL